MPNLRAGQDLTVIRRTVTGQDGYGNDIYSSVTEIIHGCAVSPGVTSEVFEGTLEVFSTATVHLPPGTTLNFTDQVKLFGQIYQVDGQPVSWSSPFTGTGSMVEAHVRIVTGGAPAT